DKEVARILNKDFVTIKVDREERPDIDAVYMSVCQAMTGSGGWPLTIFMTPEQKPFFAATYIPKTARYGSMGLMELLEEVARQWREDREKLIESGEKISDYIRKQAGGQGDAAELSIDLLHKAADMYLKSFDRIYGGFGSAPKFPAAHNLLFLLRYHLLENDSRALAMAEKTLEQMFRGGILDHIGGGFSRYSTDNRWLVPHFEKMLYDNALLIMAYLEAFKITGRELYKGVAQRTIAYVLRELSGEDGGFFCGQDADSDGIEGKYYVFTTDELREVFGQEDAQAFCDWFGISEEGNFEGKSIPNLLENRDYENDNPQMRDICGKLYKYRLERTNLHLDDKVLTSWNGLIIKALARAYAVLNDINYLNSAENGAKFISENLTDRNGRLRVRWREHDAANDGQLDDYAFYALALIELYKTTFNVEYLEKAVHFAQVMLESFYDEEKGGFYLNSAESEQLIFRPKEVYDGAMPSGNSAAGMLLIELAALTGDTKLREYADRQLSFLAAEAEGYPTGYSFALLTMTKALYPSAELVCVSAQTEVPCALKSLLDELPFVNISVLFKTKQNEQQLSACASFTGQYPIPEKGVLYYLCRNGTCEAPTEDINAVREKLKQWINSTCVPEN
ncbi:MAG: thioredoxin domain-containing protein, partial [Clostridiales bacterium]|nr:thioredoxin domain-containing protein [Clostridiales bacterium]